VRYSIQEMTQKLGEDSPLLKYLVPSFAVGCRRPTPGNGYLEALTQDNVRVATDPISEVVPEGIKLSTGEVIPVDIFICATGFDISFRPRYPIRGVNGIALSEQWKDRAKGYLSLAIPNFPNHFSRFLPSTQSDR
jgi:cation diffusion facilitator CzcD-associated flavoprotein CzcO